MARPGIHLSEVLQVSVQMLERLQKHQAAICDRLQAEIGRPCGQQADEYADFSGADLEDSECAVQLR